MVHFNPDPSLGFSESPLSPHLTFSVYRRKRSSRLLCFPSLLSLNPGCKTYFYVICFWFVGLDMARERDALIAVFIQRRRSIWRDWEMNHSEDRLLRVIGALLLDFFLIWQSKHHRLPSALPFSSCIFTVNGWLNYREEQRSVPVLFPSLFSLYFFLRWTANSFHSWKWTLCNVALPRFSLRPCSCESYSEH